MERVTHPVSSPHVTSLMSALPSTFEGALTHLSIKLSPFCSGRVLPTLTNLGFLKGLHLSTSAHFSTHSGVSISSSVSQIDLLVGFCLSPYETTGSRVQSLMVFALTPASNKALPN